jgi:hypothetical protein
MLAFLARLFTWALMVFLPAFAFAQEAPIKKVEQVFKRVERSMCKSLDIKNCKTSKSRKQRVDVTDSMPPVPRERPEKSLEEMSAQSTIASSPKPVLRKIKSEVVVAKPAARPSQKPAPKPAPVKTAALIKAEKPILKDLEQTTDCTTRLAALGATFKQEATPANQGQCSISNPVRLSSVKTSAKPILFSDEPILSCEFAATLAGWTRDVAGPLVKATTKQPLVAMATGPGFDCRGRNGDGSGKMSEHATGNAVDVGTFKLGDGNVLNVKGSNATLDALRAAACENFTTVLGPGSNSAHEEHFHFDLARRKNGYRVCN